MRSIANSLHVSGCCGETRHVRVSETKFTHVHATEREKLRKVPARLWNSSLAIGFVGVASQRAVEIDYNDLHDYSILR